MRKYLPKLSMFIFFLAFSIGYAEDVQNKISIREELTQLSSQVEQLRDILMLPTSEKLEAENFGSALAKLDNLQNTLRRTIGRLEEIEHNLDTNIKILDTRLKNILAKYNLLTDNFNSTNSSGNENNKLRMNKDISTKLNDVNNESLEDQQFQNALSNYKQGLFTDAREGFLSFINSFPYSDRVSEAFYFLADCEHQLGGWKEAAEAYLSSFSGDPSGQYSVKALFGLGVSLGALEKIEQACLTLREINLRYPGQTDINTQDYQDAAKLFSCDE